MSSMRVKRGELSIRDTFIESLKETLINEDLTIFEEIIFKDSLGKSIKITDIVILENGKFTEIEENDEIYLQLELDAIKSIIETKNPSKYMSEGLFQLLQYCDLLNVNNGFTTNFSNLLYYYHIEKPAFITKKYSGKLKERCNSLSKAILNYLKNPPSKEKINAISEDSLIQTLQSINEELKNFITKIDVKDISDSMGIFEISSDKEIISEITDEDIKNAASFLLMNQLLFYGILSEKLGLVTFIENLKSIKELSDIFTYIYHINYRAVYGYDILQFLKDDCVNVINSILYVFKKFNFHELRKDILGKIFHGIIPLNLRKRIAAYYTSNNAGELLARLCIKNENDIVFDPACGSGTLLVSALNVKNELYEAKNIQKEHQVVLEDIYGVDISIFAAHLSVINLSIQDLNSVTNKVLIFIDDAFNILPSTSKKVLFSAHPKQKATKDGVEEADSIEIPLFNVVISNPPFTRVERLTEDKKEFISKQSHMKDYMVGQAGLHIAFIIHCYNFILDGGYLAMVLPSATFSSNYSEKIEEFILDNFKIEYVISSDAQVAFSEDANFKELLLICKKNKEKEWKSHFISIKSKLENINIKILAKKISSINEDYENTSFKQRIISKKELREERNWTKFFRRELEELVNSIFKSDHLIKQDKIIRFHEGYHLDAPYFFRIPNKKWKIIKDTEISIKIKNEQNVELNIPKSFLVKTMGKPSDHEQILPQMSSYIIKIENNAQNRKIPEGDLKSFIKWGLKYEKTTMSPKQKKSKTVLDLYKIKKYIRSNRPWYTYGNYILRHKKINGITGQIGGKISLIEKFGVKTRSNIAFYSSERLTGSNSYFFGEIIIPKTNSKVLGAWFCSSFYLLLYLYNRREIGGDYGRIKIKDLSSFKCVNPHKLTKDEKKAIINAFDDYATNFPDGISLFDQIKNRNQFLFKLDIVILECLNLEISVSKEEYLESIYSAIIAEVVKIKI